MIGFIKKDLYVMRMKFKVLFFLIVVYFLMSLDNNTFINMLLPFVGTMMCISTFSYDDFNNFHAYAISMPGGREKVVMAKYITSIIMCLVSNLAGIILSILAIIVSGNKLDFDALFGFSLGSTAVTILMITISYPFIFKLGAEKGRIVTSIFVAAMAFALAFLLNKVNVIETLTKLDNNDFLGIIFFLIVIVCLIISYFISSKIYNKKEF